MPQITDPVAALEFFQEALANDGLPLQQGIIDPELFVHSDRPNGSTRLTYVRLDRRRVTALVMFVLAEPLKGNPCFQIGYAVPERPGAGPRQGYCGRCHCRVEKRLTGNGVPQVYVEAVVGTDNEPSMRVAAATLSTSPVQITDCVSGLLHSITSSRSRM